MGATLFASFVASGNLSVVNIVSGKPAASRAPSNTWRSFGGADKARRFRRFLCGAIKVTFGQDVYRSGQGVREGGAWGEGRGGFSSGSFCAERRAERGERRARGGCYFGGGSR